MKEKNGVGNHPKHPSHAARTQKRTREGFFARLRNFFHKWQFSRNIGIDLGTATVLVYVQGKGIVIKEPSVVAIDKASDRVIKVGKEAQEMLGRTPDGISALRPLKDGMINEYDVTLKMLQYFIRRSCGKTLLSPRIMIGVPAGITEVEERAILDAAREAGARKTYLLTNTFCKNRFGFHINKLILKRRTSCVYYKNFHIIFSPNCIYAFFVLISF